VLRLDNPHSLPGVQQQVDPLPYARELEGGQAVAVVQFYNAGSDDEAHFLVDEMRVGHGFSRFFGKIVASACVVAARQFASSIRPPVASADRRQHRSACARLRPSAITALSSAKFPQLSLNAADR
jgi:hypothetical protein